MKKIRISLLILSISIFTISCTDKETSRVSELVADEIQTVNNTKIDMSLEVLEVIKQKDHFASDSLSYLKKYLEEKTTEKLNQLNEDLETRIKDSIDQVEKIKNAPSYLKEVYEPRLESIEDLIESTRSIIKVFQTDYKGSYLEKTYKSIKRLEENPDEKLYSIYKVKYKFKNPLLNNAEVETSKYFYIKGDALSDEPLVYLDSKNELE